MNIGKKIQKVYEESGISRDEFAKKMCCARNMIWQFFVKSNIDVLTLTKLSRVLGHNFFLDLAEQPEVKFVPYDADEVMYFPAVDQMRWDEEGILEEKIADADMIYKYLSKKGKTYNRVIVKTDDGITNEIFVHFSEKQLSDLLDKKKQRYVDVLDWNDLLANGDWHRAEPRLPAHISKVIDVEYVGYMPYYVPQFTYYELANPTASPIIKTLYIPILAELYAKLLSMLLDNRSLTVKQLEQKDIELYTVITNGVQLPIRRLNPVNPYMIFMTEAQEAVYDMVGEPNDSDCLLMDCRPDATSYSVWVYLDRGMIEVRECTLYETDGSSEENHFVIPATDVYNKLGVTNFKDLIVYLEKRISYEDMFDSLKEIMV